MGRDFKSSAHFLWDTLSAPLDLGHFANGVYVIVVQTDKEVMQTKIIKK